ncbi:MAG: hypothetical protein IIA60_00510 [Candidatus Marinimicrobia bacterium]|nr:hypothetical protein [Candidatus Neomarinimicrobiota bacterium]
MKKIWGKETDVSPAGRNEDKGKSRLLRDWEEMEKKSGEWRGIRGKGRIWRGESRNVDYVQMTNNLGLREASLSVSGNQVNNQEDNQMDNLKVFQVG